MQPLTVIGIDCAAQARNFGLALGRPSIDGSRVWIDDVTSGRDVKDLPSFIKSWIGPGPTLLAFDAPLGWPTALAAFLADHRAGKPSPDQVLEETGKVDEHVYFRRETDREVKRRFGITPLDVGADRIARVAMSTLRLLGRVRDLTGQPIPLAWCPGPVDGVSAIEVYPAATLNALGLQPRGYKGSDRVLDRRRLVEALHGTLDAPAAVREGMIASDHNFDAALCVVAGCDFIRKLATPPRDQPTTEREGWIWVRPEPGKHDART